MSLSAYPTARVKYDTTIAGLSTADFNALHWTSQLQLRPLREQKRWEYNRDGDSDTRLDNWDDNEILEQGEVT